MFGFLIFAAVAFTVYAVVTQYRNTDASQSVPKRVWAAVVAAAAAVGALVQGWFAQ
jgi:hypothetical protein